ncbi:MAG: TuaD protein [Candidatus Uhrbacteria bacterium GW2011_GWF2_41_16]|uniref:UDP-glucose 6-dehydrogenase n=2 Tax=Candidatus Uhriibacteriota TaxID=1752732 RepID=A0A0G0YDS9_9BACT|nr:MAG: TuaD protein [Candidatus Uhrbacteria bacterium GW2011_GWA2_41_10]KKR87288.1 MAG: TuaD protein [Candidatus Uhrbacteria bacterium GW2011_GWC2_41_11]KKR98472.1 MAG: TuaD protein [Candidatus Uhrbacteria bacterium GW2011_GWF2_41_16]HBO99993.1 UDP-glucose 6-dehydrogenase [Candidatus Uhrbacteria bacterium]
MNIVVIGTGYVGLVSGLGYAKLGHRVACVDVDVAKIAALDLGEVPFYEPGLRDLLREMQEQGRIVFTTDLYSVADGAEIFLIAVGTPPTAFGEVDLRAVFHVADDIGKCLDHEAIVAIKSTVPVGTNRKVLDCVREKMIAIGRENVSRCIQVASVPEFLSEGKALEDFFAPHRIVIGAENYTTHDVMGRLHAGLPGTRICTTLENAELIKYAANAFLATKISFINEMACIAERVGADIQTVAHAIGLDPRIGPSFLKAGIGYGGSCFPKDVSALHQLAGLNGYDFKLLGAVIEVNNHQRDWFLRKIENRLGSVRGRKIAAWGLAFKGGTDDIRESAALDIIQRLCARGAEISVYDPFAMTRAHGLLSDDIVFAPTAMDAAEGADALVVLTDWQEFRDVSFSTLRERMVNPLIFDGRNLLADMHLSGLGFQYEGVGTSG